MAEEWITLVQLAKRVIIMTTPYTKQCTCNRKQADLIN